MLHVFKFKKKKFSAPFDGKQSYYNTMLLCVKQNRLLEGYGQVSIIDLKGNYYFL